MNEINTLQITLQHPHSSEDNEWPVLSVLRLAESGSTSEWRQTRLQLPPEWRKTLLLTWKSMSRAKYGRLLGEALFQPELKELLHKAIGRQTRLLFVIEPMELKSLHWERLYFPDAEDNDKWQSLAQNQDFLFSYYTSTRASKYYPHLLQSHLKILFFICSTTQDFILHGGSKKLKSFDTSDLAEALRASYNTSDEGKFPIPYKIIHQPEETNWNNLQIEINEGAYSILHIIAHGYYDPDEKLNYLLLLDEDKQPLSVSTKEFTDKLSRITPLPHLVFFSSCDTADPEALISVHGHFAQQARQILATPAVIAMSESVTQDTANTLSKNFYRHLNHQAHVDIALNKAGYPLIQDDIEQHDRYLPVLYQSLGAKPLFGLEALSILELGEQQGHHPVILDALAKLKPLIPKRAPTDQDRFNKLERWITADWEPTPCKQLALRYLDKFCEEVTDISFATLVQDKNNSLLPEADPECPFPGMRPFKKIKEIINHEERELDYRKYFFGRDEVTNTVWEKLTEPDRKILAIIGPSGSGKSSLVFAGVLFKAEHTSPPWQTRDMRLSSQNEGSPQTPKQRLEEQLQGLIPDQPALLYIDQFEELFNIYTQQERQDFLDHMLNAPKKYLHVKILFTMRADYFGEAKKEKQLEQVIDQHYFLQPMQASELRSAIEQQADRGGLEFEPELAYTILSNNITANPAIA